MLKQEGNFGYFVRTTRYLFSLVRSLSKLGCEKLILSELFCACFMAIMQSSLNKRRTELRLKSASDGNSRQVAHQDGNFVLSDLAGRGAENVWWSPRASGAS